MTKTKLAKIGIKEIEILNKKEIPYFEQVQKRTFKKKVIKIKNTLLLLIAYIFPNNKGRIFLHRLRGVNIGKGCYIGLFCFIDNLFPEYIYIENEASVNTGSMLIAHFNPRLRFKRSFIPSVSPIIIHEGAMVAINCIILPGVDIGENAMVSAGSVVDKSVEQNTIVRGNPAKMIGKFKL